MFFPDIVGRKVSGFKGSKVKGSRKDFNPSKYET
jgi:hypothetical protein